MKLFAALNTALLCFILGVAVCARTQEPQENGKPAAHEGGRAAAPAARQEPGQARSPQQEPASGAGHDEARPPQRGEASRPPQPDQHARPTGRQEEAKPPQHGEVAKPPQHEPAARTQQPGEKARPAHEPPQSQPAYRGQQQRPPEQHAAAPNRAQQAQWQEHRAQHWQTQHRTWQQRGGYQGYRVPGDRYRAEFGPPHTFVIYNYPVVFVQGYPRFQYGGYWVQIIDPWPEYWADDWFYTDPCYIEYWSDGYYLFNPRYPGVTIAVEIFG
jgi:hypothetical protein